MMRRFIYWVWKPASTRQCLVWLLWCAFQIVSLWWSGQWVWMWVSVVCFFGWMFLYNKARHREWREQERGRHEANL